MITLRIYVGFPSQLEELYQNVPIELGDKMFLMDVNVVSTPLNYNIPLGQIFM